ncbi:MAG: FecR domain-containing protein [Vicinamibacteria bacterium]
MATDPIAREREDVPESAPRRRRPAFHRDPLSLAGWSIALLALVAYWAFFVRKPAPQRGERVARITMVSGTVTIQEGGGTPWVDARLSDVLHFGDVVKTGAGSGAQIHFDSGSRVNVRPNSVVYVGGSAESSTAAWRVQSGRVSFAVAEKATEIRTPTAQTTAMQNATGNIDVSETGETGVKVFQGEAEIRTSLGETITLGQNQAVRVDAAGKAGARLDLPPPPTLVAPVVRAQLERVAPPAPTAELQWTSVANGETYHVTVDYNVTQAELLLSAALEEEGIAGTSHALRDLEPGRYFWRVAAVNRDGLEGAFSRASFFSVVAPAARPPAPTPVATPPAPLLALRSVEEIAPGIVQVAGRAAPGATVEIGGAPVLVLPDGSFSEYVRHPGGALVVKATSRAGAVAEESRTVTRP